MKSIPLSDLQCEHDEEFVNVVEEFEEFEKEVEKEDEEE